MEKDDEESGEEIRAPRSDGSGSGKPESEDQDGEEIRPLEVKGEAENAGEEWGGPEIETIDLWIDSSREIEIRELGSQGSGSEVRGSEDPDGVEMELKDPDLDLLMGWGEDSGDFGRFFDSLWRM